MDEGASTNGICVPASPVVPTRDRPTLVGVRWCSTRPGGARRSSSPSWPTTSASAARRRFASFSTGVFTRDTKGTFRARVVISGVDVCLDVNYRDSRIKE